VVRANLSIAGSALCAANLFAQHHVARGAFVGGILRGCRPCHGREGRNNHCSESTAADSRTARSVVVEKGAAFHQCRAALETDLSPGSFVSRDARSTRTSPAVPVIASLRPRLMLRESARN